MLSWVVVLIAKAAKSELSIGIGELWRVFAFGAGVIRRLLLPNFFIGGS